MSSIIDKRKEESSLVKEIKCTHTKLMHLYEKLDEYNYDTSYIKLWLEAQQNIFDPNVDESKPYWIN